MTKCRFWENRYLPIEYSLDKIQSNEGFFSLCLVKKGVATFEIDNEKCYLSAPAMICVNPDKKITILKSNHLQIKTILFTPDFINRNLSVESILSYDYEINCKLFDFPSFDLFYQTNNFYNCVIPFDVEELSKVEYLFDSIIEQLSVQPDNMWSCRARMSVIRIFDYAANLYKEAFEINQESDTLIDCILTFIEFNLEKQFTIDDLCRWYNTNRTTLMTEFKHITGKTINEFVIDKRISVSKKTLEFTNISIEELSEKCGFSSQSYFTRTFKKKTGLSPTQYRKQAIEKRIEKFQT